MTPIMILMTLLSTQGKTIMATAAMVGVILADAVTPDMSGWEDLTMKVALCAAIGWLVRELSVARKESKEEREAHKAEAKTRESMMTVSMHAQAEALQKVVDAVNEQTDYFKAVARNLIERGMNNNKAP
jgi:hypothetical protein